MTLTTFIHASAHALPQLADQSVQMIATSPPYYGLRAYAGEQGVEWPEVTYRLNEWVEPSVVPPMRCGLGMEPSPVAFIGHLILCLREWRRVLRDDGVCFVNLGDSYAGSGGPGNQRDNKAGPTSKGAFEKYENVNRDVAGVKPKDLLGIPWLFAIAARADGWFLRSDIIWAKPNPMPESVTDRPTKAHEYVFLLAKSQRYFYDADAVREPQMGSSFERIKYARSGDGTNKGRPTGKDRDDGGLIFASGLNALPNTLNPAGRNLRSVWTIATQPTPFAHFATFPEKLVEPMIRAGSSERGACPHCGKAWVRVVEREGETTTEKRKRLDYSEKRGNGGALVRQNLDYGGAHGDNARPSVTTGFAPACTCPAHEPTPCVVLDPFNGSGTTGKVAVRLGRAYVGVDIAQEYLDGVTSERFGAGVQIGMGL